MTNATGETWFQRYRWRMSHWRRAGSVLISNAVGTVAADSRLLFKQQKQSVFRQRSIDGFRMLLRADEELGRELYLHGTYEESEIDYLRENVRGTDVIFDVGANVGYHAIVFATIAKAGHVHCFEPIPLTNSILRVNVLLNGLQNVRINCCAIGDQVGERDFTVASVSSYASFVDTGQRPVQQRIVVPVRTLDDYCEENSIDRVDILKADVEGAQEGVIKGGKKLLEDSARRPRLVMIELSDPTLKLYGTSVPEMVKGMGRYQYHPFVSIGGKRVPFEQRHHNIFHNVLFSLSGG